MSGPVKVEFLTIESGPCPDGEKPQRFTFPCIRLPEVSGSVNRCGMLLIANAGHSIKRDGQGNNGGRPQWDWNGDREKPTFAPSINCGKHCGWHGFIEKGQWRDSNEPPIP